MANASRCFSPSEPSTLMHEHLARNDITGSCSKSFDGWGGWRDKTSRSKVTAESKIHPVPMCWRRKLFEETRMSSTRLVRVRSALNRQHPNIPIVALTGDPVALGMAQSLAHPGGNFTGVSIDTGPSIHGKRIALLREMFPAMSKLGCLALRIQWNGPIVGTAVRAAAEGLGLPLVVSQLEFGASEATPAAIESVSHDGANAIMLATRLTFFETARCWQGWSCEYQASFDVYIF